MAVRRRPQRVAAGQHFLRSSALAAALVRDAGVGPGDLAVDVGAGTGMLTAALARAGARVVAVESDPVLAAQLRRRFAATAVTVAQTDARSYRWPREPFAVVANLPFAGSGAILDHLLGDPRVALGQANLIVQWELARKQAAIWPATLRAVYWGAWFEIAIASRLSRSAFAPVPAVDAAVLRVERRARPLVQAEAHGRYRHFVADAFGANAPLERALRRRVTGRELRRLSAVLGFDPSSRPRDLDARQWAGIFGFADARRRVGPRATSTRGSG